MYEHASASHRLHRPTRIWDAALKPRMPMKPDEPSDLLGELLDCLFHPVARFRRLVQRKPSWTAMPWPLWSLLAFIAISNIAILLVLIAQFRVIKTHPLTIAALWLIILNPAALATFLQFHPNLLN